MAASPTLERYYTPDDLLTLADEGNYELIDGQLVEKTVSRYSVGTAARVLSQVNAFVTSMMSGETFGADLLVRAFPWSPGMVRKPDAAFVAASRIPPGDWGMLSIPPDWVLEAVSPHDLANEVRAKADLWLRAGVRMVWVAYPESREIHVFRSDAHPRIFIAEDIISGEDVFPGFSANVGALFPETFVLADDAPVNEPS